MVLLDLQTLTLHQVGHTGPEPAPDFAAGSAGSVFFCPSSVTVILCFDETPDRG